MTQPVLRYLLHMAFKGKAYHGWQKQHNAIGVQTVLEEKISILLGESIDTLGCGRTDTGVHASSFYVHFDTAQNIDVKQLVYKLNHVLPDDIAVFSINQVHEQFNARFDAKYRTYQYHIATLPNPFELDTSWFLNGKLDLEAMNQAANLLIGKKDFECFSKVHTQVNNFICEVMHAKWEQQEGKIVFTIRANRFLRNMVRAIVGTLVDVGRGKLSKQDFEKILFSKDRCEAGQSAPAQGLFLTEVYYGDWQNGQTTTPIN
jgi:tRNA pseudouridine38-40 synthase